MKGGQAWELEFFNEKGLEGDQETCFDPTACKFETVGKDKVQGV